MNCTGSGYGNCLQAYTVQDPHGKQILTTTSGWTDSVGRNIPGSWSGVGYQAADADPVPGIDAGSTDGSGCPTGSTGARYWDVPYEDGTPVKTVKYWLCYKHMSVTTAFNVDHLGPYAATGYETAVAEDMLIAVVLPNHTSYNFTYDPTFLDLTEIDLPTGGSVKYTWATVNWDVCAASAPRKRVVTSRTVDDGVTPATWHYTLAGGADCTTSDANGTAAVNIVDKPDGNSEEHDYFPGTMYGLAERTVTYFAGSAAFGHEVKKVTEYMEQVPTPYWTESEQQPDFTWSGIMASITMQESVPGQVEQRQTVLYDPVGTAKTMSEEDYVNVPVGAPYLFDNPNNTYTSNPAGYCTCAWYPGHNLEYVYDYGTATAPGALMKTTQTTYMFDDGQAYNSNYLNANLLDLPSSTSVYMASNYPASSQPYLLSSAAVSLLDNMSQSKYTYDETATWDGVALSSGAIAGDLTTLRRLIENKKVGSGPHATIPITNEYMVFNSDGMVIRSYPYAKPQMRVDSFDCGGSIPHQITLGVGWTESQTFSHDCASGKLTSHRDANSQTAYYAYEPQGGTAGQLKRLVSVTNPDGGTIGISYTDGYYSTVALDTAVDSTGTHEIQTVAYDHLGRTRSVVTSAPEGAIEQDTTYDNMGRKATTTNPFEGFFTTSVGVTTNNYCGTSGCDALGRLLSVTNQDGSVHSYSYAANVTTEADETGSAATRTYDAIGELISVNEPSPCTGATSGNITTYTYDLNGNLSTITQPGMGSGGSCNESGGSRNRSFAYDSLSELTGTTNPESGTIGYGYNITGTTPTGLLIERSDGNGVVRYCYDGMNRLTGKFYDNGGGTAYIPSTACNATDLAHADVKLVYGTSSTGNTVGRLIEADAYDQIASPAVAYASSTGRAYTSMGQLAAETQSSPVHSAFNFNYTYDYMGHVASSQIPTSTSGALSTINYTYDAAARLKQVTSTLADATHPSVLFDTTSSTSAPHYGALGLIEADLALDNTTTTPAITMSRDYDIRTRLYKETDTASGGSSASSGTITVSGGTTGGTASGYFAVSGSDNLDSTNVNWDYGDVQVTVNGTWSAVASYGYPTNISTMVASLAADLTANSGGAITATASGNHVDITANSPGVAGNYTLTVFCESDDLQWGFPSFCAVASGGGAMTEGRDPDTGTVTATINGYSSGAVAWTGSSNASSVATDLASAIQSGSSGTLTATTSGNVVTVQSVSGGSRTNWTVSVSSTDTAGNASPGFTFTHATTLSGGGTAYRYQASFGPTGDVQSYYDTVMGDWDMTGGYDALHRLISAHATAGPFAGTKGCWRFDSFGNRVLNELGTGSCDPVADAATASYDANNRFPQASGQTFPYPYSANGNLLFDGTHNFTYDVEDRICAVYTSGIAQNNYLYDAFGNRISTGSAPSITGNCGSSNVTKAYVLDQAGQDIAEFDGAGNWVYSNVYAGGRLLATYKGSATYFAMNDWIGNKRAEIRADGTICGTYSNMPWGDYLSGSGSGCADNDPSEQHFTGKMRDSESNLDYFGARYYDSAFGRWMSPDWSDKAEPVPYAKLDNPQSLNLYSYVSNNPVSRADMDGHCWPVCTVLAGAAVGAVAELAHEAIQGKGFSGTKIGAAAAGGAVAGLVGPLGEVAGMGALGVMGYTVGGNVAGGLTERLINSATSGKQETPNPMAAKDVLLDAAAGVVGSQIAKGAAKVAGKMIISATAKTVVKTVIESGGNAAADTARRHRDAKTEEMEEKRRGRE